MGFLATVVSHVRISSYNIYKQKFGLQLQPGKSCRWEKVILLTICFDQEIYNICVALHGSKVQRSAAL
jgi:hypothetical protein